MEQKEIWKSIDNYSNYSISNNGRVINELTKKILSNYPKNGYYYVNLWDYKIKKHKIYALHQLVSVYFIENPNNYKMVDHIDGNRLNNNYINLRWCSSQQNNMNRKKISTNASSKFKGVTWDKSRNKWLVAIVYNYKRQHIGRFENEIDAAKAYNEKAKLIFGEFACFNKI